MRAAWTFGFLGGAGALVALVGTVLPWAQLEILGLALRLPGALWPMGIVSLGVALLGLVSLGRAPALACVLGLLCVGAAWQGRAWAPREIVRRKSVVVQSLAPINDRLARIAVPPIEPFGSIGRSADHQGIGGDVTLLGGLALFLGGLGRTLALRNAGRCGNCGNPWRNGARFCVHCGNSRTSEPSCTRCGEPLQTMDAFCSACGQRTAGP
jgi:hypothetical protein